LKDHLELSYGHDFACSLKLKEEGYVPMHGPTAGDHVYAPVHRPAHSYEEMSTEQHGAVASHQHLEQHDDAHDPRHLICTLNSRSLLGIDKDMQARYRTLLRERARHRLGPLVRRNKLFADRGYEKKGNHRNGEEEHGRRQLSTNKRKKKKKKRLDITLTRPLSVDSVSPWNDPDELPGVPHRNINEEEVTRKKVVPEYKEVQEQEEMESIMEQQDAVKSKEAELDLCTETNELDEPKQPEQQPEQQAEREHAHDQALEQQFEQPTLFPPPSTTTTEGGASIVLNENEEGLVNVKVPQLHEYDDLPNNAVVCTHVDTVVASSRHLSTREREVPFDANPWLPLERAHKNALLPLRQTDSLDQWDSMYAKEQQQSKHKNHYSTRGNLTPRVTTPLVYELPRMGTPLMGVRQLLPSRSGARKRNGGRQSQSNSFFGSAEMYFEEEEKQNNDNGNGTGTGTGSRCRSGSYGSVGSEGFDEDRRRTSIEWGETNGGWGNDVNGVGAAPFFSSRVLASSSRINPAQLSLNKYHLKASLKSSFKQYGHNVHSAAGKRKSRKQGKLISGFGTMPDASEWSTGRGNRKK
jgi:hypothetical protein